METMSAFVRRKLSAEGCLRMKQTTLLLALLCLNAALPLRAQEATIRVRANDVLGRVTRTMTGACLEDVNHEVYGGLYSQMIFGESFQEPTPPPVIKHFTAFGGDWVVRDGVVSVGSGPGHKLICDQPALSSGEVEVEVFLPGKASGVAGLIVKVRE